MNTNIHYIVVDIISDLSNYIMNLKDYNNNNNSIITNLYNFILTQFDISYDTEYTFLNNILNGLEEYIFNNKIINDINTLSNILVIRNNNYLNDNIMKYIKLNYNINDLIYICNNILYGLYYAFFIENYNKYNDLLNIEYMTININNLKI